MIEKTAQMKVMENDDPQGRDIRAIIGEALVQHGSLNEAGWFLPVNQSTLSRWVRMLKGRLDVTVRPHVLSFEGWPITYSANGAETVAPPRKRRQPAGAAA